MLFRKQEFVEIEFLKSIPVICRLWKTVGVETQYFEKVTSSFHDVQKLLVLFDRFNIIMFFFLGYRQLLDICILLETVFQ